MNDGLVLHVAVPPGGGVDRHVRDLAAGSSLRHATWHATGSADVVEMLAPRGAWPLSRDAFTSGRAALGDWLRGLGIGAIHVHSLAACARERATWLRDALAVPVVATLHDVLFADPRGFDRDGALHTDEAWLRDVAAFLRSCAAVVAPSAYIASLARDYVPGLAVEVVPNGIAPPAPDREPCTVREDFARRKPRHVVAILGAIGPHKGSAVVEALAASLAGPDIALVVVGYLDAQVHAGWRAPNLYVHGPFDERDTRAWLDAYGARIVLFPNRVPESFSYALSEAWAAGRAVLVPDEGALGERLRANGGGWLVPPRSGAEALAERLRSLLDDAAADEVARVQSAIAPDDAARIPRLADMTRSLDALYRRFGVEPGAALDATAAPAQALLAANLDASLFRAELARLADERVQLEQGLEEERRRGAEYERESRAWIAKIEADLEEVQAQLAAQVAQRQACENAAFELRQEVSRLTAALDRLPGFVRRYLVRRPRDGQA
jgi:glycosyltransferase involved in cell wall biosynthesis